MKRFPSFTLCILLIGAFLVQPVSAQPSSAPPIEISTQPGHKVISNSVTSVTSTENDNLVQETSGRYIVQLKTPSLVAYDGEVPGIQKAPVDQLGKIILNMGETKAYLNFINSQIDWAIRQASNVIGRDVNNSVAFRYDAIFGGFAAEMSEGEALAIAQLEEVQAVYPDTVRYVETDVSPGWLGTTGIWDGSYVPGIGLDQLKTKGEGVLVGILDTGINMDHPSFAATGPVDGFVHTNPFGAGVYKGLCKTDPANYICNEKLVGVYGYINTAGAIVGEDDHGHGSHTASTVAGNAINVTYSGVSRTISGMAAHANIIAYDVCDLDGGCPDSASIAAAQQAMLDGVDVINYSIGPSNGPGQSPYADPIELAFLEIVRSGGVVSTSAGNSGPNPQTVWKGAPWDITVANTSHGRGNPTLADVLSISSSRGPFTLLDVLEPEIAAPGTFVLASYATGNPKKPYGGINPAGIAEVVLMSGTSMASPHVAGNAALLRALFPSWTGMEIKSALMMTALTGTTRDYDNTVDITPFDYGNGRLDMTKAALTGLVMNETYANLKAANPDMGGDVRMLNIPSYQNSLCPGACSFTRTFRSVADAAATYTATVDASTSPGLTVKTEPANFTIKPGALQKVVFTIYASGIPSGKFVFGRVTFKTNNQFGSGEAISSVAIPFAVKTTLSTIPNYARFSIGFDQGSVFLRNLQSIPVEKLLVETNGLTQGTITELEISKDTTPSEVYDSLNQVYWKSFSVPAGSAVRFVFEVLTTSAEDLDLYFGKGSIPSASGELYAAATVKSLEYLSVPIDSTTTQTYWVLLQNWAGKLNKDSVKVSEAVVVKADTGKLVFSTRPAVPIGTLTPYDLIINYNLPATAIPTTWYGRLTIKACQGLTCIQIGVTDVDFIRDHNGLIYYFPWILN